MKGRGWWFAVVALVVVSVLVTCTGCYADRAEAAYRRDSCVFADRKKAALKMCAQAENCKTDPNDYAQLLRYEQGCGREETVETR